MLASPKTRALPIDRLGGTLDQPDVVRALLLCGTDEQFFLPPRFSEVTVGAAPDNDIVLANDAVSFRHCKLQRRGRMLRVFDQGSRNGTWLDGVRQQEGFDLPPGRSFIVGGYPNRLLAMSDAMCAVYPELTEILGTEGEQELAGGESVSPSDLLAAATGDRHILIISQAGCRQQRLAALLHAVSARRTGPLLDAAELGESTKSKLKATWPLLTAGTVVVDLGRPLSAASTELVRALFAKKLRCRVIVLAPSASTAERALGFDLAFGLQRVALSPLDQRPKTAIPRLFDRALERQGSTLRFARLSRRNRKALLGLPWPNNFISLDEVAHTLATINKVGAINRAARLLGKPVSTLYYWYNTSGFERSRLTEDQLR